jgi:hypothetical protein
LWNTTLEIEDFPLLLLVSGVMISQVVKLTVAGPSTAISAFPSRRHLEQALEHSRHRLFERLLDSVHGYVQDLAGLD